MKHANTQYDDTYCFCRAIVEYLQLEQYPGY